ncbi:LamG domain-containing protein [Flavobacterium sp.]|uniref:LamG domain-containing protein n=1 Tax=Flavobacterium sp. TaxID=239 RepID=UPI002C41E08C|nr:LamG domain-containing protein [Flavobacterium sp.]HSD08086.1 LamG domain-containing protein [Flavobacterium sp.]
MKKVLLLLVMFAFSILANSQTAIQEFNFNGTLSNTTNDITFIGISKFVKDRTGVANKAIRVVNETLEATMKNLPLSNSARTVSIWVKYNDVTTANYIWGYGSLANAQYFGLLQQSTSNTVSDLNLAGWGPDNDVVVPTTIASGNWYNFTVTYDGLTSKIYRDGILIKSFISPRKLTSAIVFGIGKMGSAISINADIDDLKIYNVALTPDQVATLYANNSTLASNDVVKLGNQNSTFKKEIINTKAVPKSNTKAKVVSSAPVETINVKLTEIYSSEGLKVLSGDKNEIDITALAEGNYLLKVVKLHDSNDKKLTEN